MAFAIGWIMTLLIISGSVLFGCYMYYCYQDGIKMFESNNYEKQIKDLEKRVKTLEDKL